VDPNRAVLGFGGLRRWRRHGKQFAGAPNIEPARGAGEQAVPRTAPLNPRTKEFCARIRSGARPQLVVIQPEPGWEPNNLRRFRPFAARDRKIRQPPERRKFPQECAGNQDSERCTWFDK
jgi:hypothetical protein